MGAVREHLHYSPEEFDALPWWQRHAYLEYLVGRHKLPLFDDDEDPASGGLTHRAGPSLFDEDPDDPGPAMTPGAPPPAAPLLTPPTEDGGGARRRIALPIKQVAAFGPAAEAT